MSLAPVIDAKPDHKNPEGSSSARPSMSGVPSGPRTLVLRPSSFVLPSILLLGALLRLGGIDFGLPHLYHWDEKMYFHGAFYAIATGGSTESLVYGNVPYLLVPLVWLTAALKGAAPNADLSRAITLYLGDPTPFYLLGRIAWVGLQLLAIWVCYRVGTRALSHRAGLIGAFFLSVGFLGVAEGHYVKGDTTAMLGALLAAWAALHLLRSPSWRSYAVLGAAVGLSLSFKLYTYTLVLLPVLVHLSVWRPLPEALRRWYLLLPSAVFAILAFLATLPAFLADPAGTRETFEIESAITLASVPTGGVPVWLYYWTGHLPEGMGWPLYLCGVAGLVAWVVRGDRVRLLLLALPLLLWLGISTRTNGFARYALPIVPFLVLAAADLLDRFSKITMNRRDAETQRNIRNVGSLATPPVRPESGPRSNAWPSRFIHNLCVSASLRLVFLCVLCLALALPSLLHDLRFAAYASSPDTRTLAARWVERNLPAGATIVEEGGQGFEAVSTLGPPLRADPAEVDRMWVSSSLRPPHEFWREPLLAWLRTYTPTYKVTFASTLTRDPSKTSAEAWGSPDAFVIMSWRSDPEAGTPASPLWADLRAEYNLAARFDCRPCFPNDPYAWAVDYPTLEQVDLASADNVAGPRVWVYTRK